MTHDEFLSHVNKTTSQVTRVGSTKSGVNKSLTSTRSSNEVLKSFETFTEVALDGTRNHVTTRVSHETTHTGDLTHLRHVSASTRVDHHVDGVGEFGLECRFHCVFDLVGCF